MPRPAPSQLTDKQLSWLNIAIHGLSVQFLALWLHTCYRVKITGRENIPKGPRHFIVAANHRSGVDIPAVAVALNFLPIAFMSKQELWTETPWYIGEYFRSVAAFAVNRDKVEVSTIKSALKALKHDRWALGIFPEGTRAHHLSDEEKTAVKVRENKKGVAFIAKAGKAPILPVGVVRGGKDNKHVSVIIGEMMPFDPALDVDGLSKKIQNRLEELVHEAEKQLG